MKECQHSDHKNGFLVLNIKCLHMIGYLPDEGNRILFVILMAWGFFLSSHSVLFLLMEGHIYWSKADIDDVMNNSGIILTNIPLSVVLFSLFIKRKEYKETVTKLERNFCSMNNNEWLRKNKAIGQKWLKRGKILTKAYLSYLFVVAVLWILTPSFKDSVEVSLEDNKTVLLQPLPLKLWPKWQEIDTSNYGVEYFYQALVITFQASTNPITETFFFVLIMFITCQFDMITDAVRSVTQSDISELIKQERNIKIASCTPAQNISGPVTTKIQNHYIEKEDVFSMGDVQAEMEKCLLDLVQYHQVLVTEVNRVKKLLSPIFLTHFLSASATVCVFGYVMTTWSMSMLSRGSVVIMILGRVGVYCFFGTLLTVKSLGVAEAAYGSEWYSTRSRNIKTIVLMMVHRAQRPVVLKAGFIYSLSLETFTSILQASYSYLTLIRKINQ